MDKWLADLDGMSIIQLFGGLSILVSAGVSFLAVTIKDYFVAKREERQSVKLEELKHQFTRTEQLVSSITTSSSDVYLASNPKIISSYETIWECMIEIRSNLPVVVSLAYSVLKPEELENFKLAAPDHMRKNLLELESSNFIEKHYGFFNRAQLQRPFVGSKAWQIFFTYQVFIGRLYFLLERAKVHDKIEVWYKDNGFLEDVLVPLTGRETLNQLVGDGTTAFQNVINYLEVAMQEEVQSHIFGRKITDSNLSQAIALSTISLPINELNRVAK